MAEKKMPNLKTKYQAEVAPALMQKFGFPLMGAILKNIKKAMTLSCKSSRNI